MAARVRLKRTITPPTCAVLPMSGAAFELAGQRELQEDRVADGDLLARVAMGRFCRRRGGRFQLCACDRSASVSAFAVGDVAEVSESSQSLSALLVGAGVGDVELDRQWRWTGQAEDLDGGRDPDRGAWLDREAGDLTSGWLAAGSALGDDGLKAVQGEDR